MKVKRLLPTLTRVPRPDRTNPQSPRRSMFCLTCSSAPRWRWPGCCRTRPRPCGFATLVPRPQTRGGSVPIRALVRLFGSQTERFAKQPEIRGVWRHAEETGEMKPVFRGAEENGIAGQFGFRISSHAVEPPRRLLELRDQARVEGPLAAGRQIDFMRSVLRRRQNPKDRPGARGRMSLGRWAGEGPSRNRDRRGPAPPEWPCSWS